MASTRTESCYKFIIFLFLVICHLDYCTLEASFPSEHLLFPTSVLTVQKEYNMGAITTSKKEVNSTHNFEDSSLKVPKPQKKFTVKFEIWKENSSCHLMKVNKESTITIEKDHCTIIVDKLDGNTKEISDQLEIFCRQDENFEFTKNIRNIGMNDSNKCELKKRNGYRYIIMTRETMKSDILVKICENFKLLNEADIDDFDSSICISVSEHYLQYHNQKCCAGSFDFIPKGALQVEVVMLWLEEDGYSHIIEIFYITSFICLCIIFASGIVSRNYRSDRGNQILIHFAFSIFCQFILHMIACSLSPSPFWCNVQSLLSHYFSLVESCWTSIIAYLQYKRFVKVFDNEPNHLIVKLCTIAYILPIIPISLWILYHHSNAELTNYLTFALPELSILLINFTLLILITRNIVFVKNEYIEHKKSLSMEVKLIFFLFFVLDFSWFDIILANLTNNKTFIYLFLFTQSSQGFMLFFVFGIMNDHNRFIYRKFMSKYSRKFIRI